jgi:hypothetical protein
MNTPYPNEIPANLHEKLAELDPLDLDAFSREYRGSRKSKPLAFWLNSAHTQSYHPPVNNPHPPVSTTRAYFLDLHDIPMRCASRQDM